MLTFSIFDERAASLSRVPSHSGQVVKVDRPVDERPDVRLHRLRGPWTRNDFWICRDQALRRSG